MDFKEKIQGIEPEIIEQELIQDGLNKNYRPLKRRYTLEDGSKIEETIVYQNTVNSAGWMAVKSASLKEI